MQKIIPFLMFDGRAEEAMNFYTSIFNEVTIKDIKLYGKEGPGKEGSVFHATFVLNGLEFMCIDSATPHNFTFTPALSLYVNCSTEQEINSFYTKLQESGQIMMPLDKYPFSNKFAWIADKFGVSWQLNLKL